MLKAKIHKLLSRQCVALAQAVVKAPKFCHITPILISLLWLKVNERIEYKLLSLTLLKLLSFFFLSCHCSTYTAPLNLLNSYTA